jgi:hypothetical protein
MRPRNGDMQDTRIGTYVDRRGNLREVRMEIPDPAIVRALRKRTPEQRMETGLRHSVFLRQQTRAFLEGLHPDWTPEQVNQEMARRFLGPELWDKATEPSRPSNPPR